MKGQDLPRRRITLWLSGPLGVLAGFILAIIVLEAVSGWGTPAEVWGFTLVPAVAGFVLRVGTTRQVIGSIGTALGWALFIGFLTTDLPVISGVARFVLMLGFFLPLGIGLLIPAALILGFILGGEWLMGKLSDVFVPSRTAT